MTFTTDALNPKFVFYSPLHARSTDLAEHVDHAIIALDGRAPLGGSVSLEPLAPVAPGEAALRIELWVNDLDDYTCTYGFLCSSEDGRVPHARGERSVVSVDPASRRPSPWSREFIATHSELLKDLPAYA
ncbi:MAG TPA: thioesterase family protein [Thermoanaerobaculia bacterium]|nr:thioesterase family protein [Thermoanaerobaculia bacterium]